MGSKKRPLTAETIQYFEKELEKIGAVVRHNLDWTHFMIFYSGKRADFWPSSEKWRIKGVAETLQGFNSLIAYLKGEGKKYTGLVCPVCKESLARDGKGFYCVACNHTVQLIPR